MYVRCLNIILMLINVVCLPGASGHTFHWMTSIDLISLFYSQAVTPSINTIASNHFTSCLSLFSFVLFVFEWLTLHVFVFFFFYVRVFVLCCRGVIWFPFCFLIFQIRVVNAFRMGLDADSFDKRSLSSLNRQHSLQNLRMQVLKKSTSYEAEAAARNYQDDSRL